MDIISFFYYNDKKFLIAKKGKKLLYCITENNINRFKLSIEEKSIFYHVLTSITANSKASFFVRLLSYNDKFYKLFFNPEKNLYYTDSIDSKIISYVNFNFNHVSEFCYIDNIKIDAKDKNKKFDKFFQRTIKIGTKVVFISVLAALSLNLLTGCSVATKEDDLIPTSETVIASIREEPEEKNPNYNGGLVIDRTQEEQDYHFSIIEDALENNTNLTDEEKAFIRQLKFIFDENHEYIDIEMVKERLSTLKINYDSNTRGNYGGVYNTRDNEITLYDCTNFGDCQISGFIHEFLHILQQPSNDFLKELSNEFFTRETVRRLYDAGIISEDDLRTKDYTIVPLFGNGYDDYMPTYYVLAELLDEETLRKYQFGCDTNTIIKGLSYDNDKIINQENAYAFIADINSARVYNEATQMFDLVGSFEREEIISKCYNDLNYYYKLKKGYEIKDNLQIAINYYEQPTLSGMLIIEEFSPYTREENKLVESLLVETANKQEDVTNSKFGFYRVVIPKTYLSNDHINPTISFNSPSSTPTIEITEELAEIFKESIGNIKENDKEKSQ